ncbi:hypothetical protein RJ640_019653 [Escallonia rubra]|uniref:DNA-directed RNA polymerase subunit n=1 Tax=Escallonia rubra TaxID=112253 RepID=A0AA88U4I6_9ASTE|nr:hypothetical protein RJ640_019653 [Escallonia rubra]
MFYLSKIEHTLRLPPHLLNLPINQAIKGELEGLFLDKVIADLGLCISIYDIHSIDGGFITPGDGASTYTVMFRMIMFRPFVGEVIAAKLKESDREGLKLSLGFFDDIHVPEHLLPMPKQFEPESGNSNQGRWIWEFNGDNYPIDAVDEIRFRVHHVTYPSLPVEQEKASKPFAPMIVIGSLDADGLGPISWWV